MILLMTWGGFALLSAIVIGGVQAWRSRSKNKYSSIEAKEVQVVDGGNKGLPVVQGQPVGEATSAPAQARGGGRRFFGRPFRRQQQFPAIQTSINQV